MKKYLPREKNRVATVLVGGLIFVLSSMNLNAENKGIENLKTEIQKASYGVGAKYGEGMKKDLSDLDLDAFIMGLKDAFEGKEPQLSPEELNQALASYQQRKMAEAREVFAKNARNNLEDGRKFLAENKTKDGVKETESGLQYKVLVEADGQKPGDKDTVKVHYHGTLVDGTIFDSSVDRGEPTVFPVNGVIKGWTEALMMMPVGSKWRLFIPSELAYGERGTRGVIGPNATLIFDVELIGIES